MQHLYLLSIWFLFCRVDSIMLIEEGFNVVSVDASDKMLKYALKARWDRRKEPAFDQWGMTFFILFRLKCHVRKHVKVIHTIVFSVVFKVCIIRSHPCSVPQVTSSWYFPLFFLFAVIEEANWLMLQEDIQKPGDGFDAVICLGNSFAHLPDFKGIWSVTSFLFSPLKKKRRHLGFIQDHLKTNVHLCIDVLYCIFRLHTPNVKPPPQSQFIQCNVLAEHLIILVMLYCS